ncbi:MAG: hypothetical protein ABEH80_08285, partial [Halobaculum sp.]
MDRDTLVLGIAAVFAGTFVTMSVLALSHSLFLFFVAVPFGAAAYFMWWQVSEDIEDRVRGRRRDPDTAAERRAADARRRAAEGATGGSSRFAEEARRRADGFGPDRERATAEAGGRQRARDGPTGRQRARDGPTGRQREHGPTGRQRGRRTAGGRRGRTAADGRRTAGDERRTAESTGMPAGEAYDTLGLDWG